MVDKVGLRRAPKVEQGDGLVMSRTDLLYLTTESVNPYKKAVLWL